MSLRQRAQHFVVLEDRLDVVRLGRDDLALVRPPRLLEQEPRWYVSRVASFTAAAKSPA